MPSTQTSTTSETQPYSAEDEARIGEAVLFGDRAETMQRGFDACMALATDKSLDSVRRQHKAHLN